MAEKTAVIIGAGPNMGRAIAARFAREGFAVLLVGRTQQTLDSVAVSLREEGADPEIYPADLSRTEACENALGRIAERAAAPDVVVYNAGAWHERDPLDITPAEFEADLTLCVTSAHAAVTAFAPGMVERGSGTLLFTGGGLALSPESGSGVISLTAGKSALRGYALALHEALKPKGIHAAAVTIAGTVEPGGAFDPDRIAEAYWQLHCQRGADRQAEIVFRGDG